MHTSSLELHARWMSSLGTSTSAAFNMHASGLTHRLHARRCRAAAMRDVSSSEWRAFVQEPAAARPRCTTVCCVAQAAPAADSGRPPKQQQQQKQRPPKGPRPAGGAPGRAAAAAPPAPSPAPPAATDAADADGPPPPRLPPGDFSRVRKAEFVGSAVDLRGCPPDGRHPEFAVIGRSNVGKSSLINMLTGSDKLARVSKEPGARSGLLN